MAPRPLWSGTISFGLVTVPVRLVPAIAEHKLQFHLIHELCALIKRSAAANRRRPLRKLATGSPAT